MAGKQRPIYIDGYRVDLAIKEGHEFPSETTDHPVEDGSDISDHIRNLPNEISMDCVVSDTPIGDVATERDASNVTLGDGEIADPALPSDEAYAHLQKIRDERRLVTVETSLGTFTNMALINLSVPREAATTGGLFFTVTFKHLEIKENRRFIVRTAAPSGQAPKDLGGATPLPMKVTKVLRWLKGVPPGAPLVDGFQSETVYIGQLRVKLNGVKANNGGLAEATDGIERFFHEDQVTELTIAERSALNADLIRDATTRARARAALHNRQYVKQLQQQPGLPNNRNPQTPSTKGLIRERPGAGILF